MLTSLPLVHFINLVFFTPYLLGQICPFSAKLQCRTRLLYYRPANISTNLDLLDCKVHFAQSHVAVVAVWTGSSEADFWLHTCHLTFEAVSSTSYHWRITFAGELSPVKRKRSFRRSDLAAYHLLLSCTKFWLQIFSVKADIFGETLHRCIFCSANMMN